MQFRKHLPIWVILLVFFAALGAYIFFNHKIALWAYPSSENRNGELLKDFLSLSGGLAVIAGLYLAFIRSRAIERTVENQQEQIKNQQVEINLTRDSNLNEQFKNAVEHLGSEKEPVILGGVAELSQLASTQPEKFAQVVAQIFTSYCKSEAHVKNSDDKIKWSVIRAIISDLAHKSVFHNLHIDLSHTNLFSTSIRNATIENWDLSYSKIPYDMFMVKLKNCDLSLVRGFVCRYEEITMENCKGFRMFFENSRFSDLRVSKGCSVSFIAIESEFWNCRFNSELSSSDFYNCYFKNVKFKEFMSSNNFKFCGLKYVEFPEEGVSSTHFDGSQMSDVSFKGFTTKVTFRGVDATREFLMTDLWPKVFKKLRKTGDLTSIDFPPFPHRLEENENFTEDDGYSTITEYNKIIKKFGFLSNKEIQMPREWEVQL